MWLEKMELFKSRNLLIIKMLRQIFSLIRVPKETILMIKSWRRRLVYKGREAKKIHCCSKTISKIRLMILINQ